MDIHVKRLTDTARIPSFAHIGDAGADLYADVDEIIESGETGLIGTGIVLELPDGYEGIIRPRSGLSLRKSILILNSPGTIDAGYRGEVKIIMHNLSKETFQIKIGDRIAQLCIRPVPDIRFIEVEKVDTTDRGTGGFGSTGL